MTVSVITSRARRRLDNSSPEAKAASLGSAVGQNQDEAGVGQTIASGAVMGPTVFVQYAVTADATSGLAIFNADCPFAIRIIQVIVEPTVANASATAKLTDGTNDITNTIACAVDKTMAMAGTVDDAYSTIAKNGTLKVVTNGAADRAKVTILAMKV